MKILHVAPSIARSYGGPTRSLAGYAAASLADGSTVEIVAPAADRVDFDDLAGAVGAERIRVFPSVGSNAFVFSGALLRWLSSHSSDFDVIHVHGLFNPLSSLAARMAMRSGRPVVIRPFGTLSRYTYAHRRTALKALWLATLERRNIERAAALHFTTIEERDQAAWHGPAVALRAHIVPPPFFARTAAGLATPGQARSNDVVFIGRLDPVKNLEALIDAWPGVVRALPDARLVLAGAGDRRYTSSLERKANSAGASVRFAGFLDENEKRELLRTAGAFVLPSHHENFGIAALEAIAAGVPVIISPRVQLREFIEADGVGIVAETDAESLSAGILHVLADNALRARAHSAGPELVNARFGPRVIGPRLTAMYLDAVNYATRKSRNF